MSLLCFVILSPAAHHNGLSMNHALLGLSPNIPPGPKEGDLAHDMSHEAAAHKRIHTDKGESRLLNILVMCFLPFLLSPKSRILTSGGTFGQNLRVQEIKKSLGTTGGHDPSCADKVSVLN